MGKPNLREKLPDMARLIDDIREYMGEPEKMRIYYTPHIPWVYWWIPSPTIKRPRR